MARKCYDSLAPAAQQLRYKCPGGEAVESAPNAAVNRLLTSRDFSRCVSDGENIHLARLYVVDEKVRAFQDFSDPFNPKLRDHPSGQWKFGNLLGTPRQTVNNPQGVLR